MTLSQTDDALVLVVDDNDALRSVVKRALESVRIQVMTSTNGPEALDLIEQHAVTIAITDLEMPEMDGWQFCAAAHAKFPALILGIMSGWDVSDQGRLAAHGVSFVVPKPFNIRELQTQVLAILGRSRP